MKCYGFVQTFAVHGGSSSVLVDGLMGHAVKQQGWPARPVADLAFHQMAEHVAVSGSVEAADVVEALRVFVEFTTEFLARCTKPVVRPHSGPQRSPVVFVPMSVEITYDEALIRA